MLFTLKWVTRDIFFCHDFNDIWHPARQDIGSDNVGLGPSLTKRFIQNPPNMARGGVDDEIYMVLSVHGNLKLTDNFTLKTSVDTMHKIQ